LSLPYCKGSLVTLTKESRQSQLSSLIYNFELSHKTLRDIESVMAANFTANFIAIFAGILGVHSGRTNNALDRFGHFSSVFVVGVAANLGLTKLDKTKKQIGRIFWPILKISNFSIGSEKNRSVFGTFNFGRISKLANVLK
jgi:hypothetical protein